MSEDEPVEAVFGLLSDRTRVDILRAVALAQREGAGGGPMALGFSELYDRVDVDSTSKLSYHLGELTGTYLQKGAQRDGYSLTHAGERIARFILSGNYRQPDPFGPVDAEGTCIHCGATDLQARLSGQFVRVDCRDCGRPAACQPVAPVQTEAPDGEAVVASVRHTSVRNVRDIRAGVCPACNGRLDTEIADVSDRADLPEADTLIVQTECPACLRAYNSPLTLCLAYHPASVAFHWDRGLDITERAPWEFNAHLRAGRWRSDLRSTSPPRYEVELHRGDDALRLVVDDDVSVRRSERVRRDGPGDSTS